MKLLNKANIKRMIIILGIVIIPLMYSYFYLSAFWDPYSKLEDLPVAIVNKDEGAIVNDVKRNIGDELKEKIGNSNSLNFCFVTQDEANKGLTDGKYYAVIVIPKDFTSNISSASNKEKTTASLIYSPNEKTNYLATQILSKAILQLSDTVKANVTFEVVNELSGKLNEVPSELSKINAGVTELKNGASTLTEGTSSLKDGTIKLNSNYTTFNQAIVSLNSGSTKLNDGIKTLDSGISTAYNGAKTLDESTKELYKITAAAKSLNAGITTLNTSANTYVNGVNTYIAQSNEIGQKIGAYVLSNPTSMQDPNIQYIMGILTNPNTSVQSNALVSGGNTLKAGTNTLNENMTAFSSKTNDLQKINDGVYSLSQGLQKLKSGSGELSTGSENLKAGVSKISTASNEVASGINLVSNGAIKLNDGSSKLEEGLTTANNSISDGINTTNIELQKLNGISEFTKEPVKVEQEVVNSVPNYGTAFSSYFMSLSLWVGGIIIFVGIYLDADEKFKILSRHSKNKVLRTFIYLIIGMFQAVLLAFVLRTALKLEVTNVPMYYGACILVAFTFISIIQFCMINFKDAGKFIVILLLILQLTACGGTFPMELVPRFFNKIYAFMPMTYSVNLFKEVISGSSKDVITFNLSILSIILFVFIAMTILGGKIRKSKEASLAV